MTISIDDLRAVVQVADDTGFGKAAATLRLTQSALTRRLQKVEEELGARLFDRSTRQVRPTAIGNEFLPAARRILNEYERSLGGIRDVIAKRRGLVTMTSLMTVAYGVLPAVLSGFNDRYPKIQVRLLDDTGDRIAEHVKSGDAEFGVDMEHAADPDLSFEPLLTEPYVVACRPTHPLAGSNPIEWEDMQNHRLAVLGAASGIGRQLDAANRSGQWLFEVQHLSTLMGLIGDGRVAGIVPALVLGAHRGADLVSRPLADQGASRRIGVIRRRGAAMSPAARSLLDHVRRELRQLP